MKQKTIFSIITATSVALFSSCASHSSTDAATSETTATTATTDTAEAQDTSATYPVAKHMVDPTTGQPVKDHYISPFKPYNPIVAKGFKSGQLAGDPSTIKADPKTGKADNSTMKVFKLP